MIFYNNISRVSKRMIEEEKKKEEKLYGKKLFGKSKLVYNF